MFIPAVGCRVIDQRHGSGTLTRKVEEPGMWYMRCKDDEERLVSERCLLPDSWNGAMVEYITPDGERVPATITWIPTKPFLDSGGVVVSLKYLDPSGEEVDKERVLPIRDSIINKDCYVLKDPEQVLATTLNCG